MSRASVDHYGATYGKFADQVYATIRAEAFGEDIGQTGWLTRDEQDLFVSWLKLGSESRLLDIACGSGGPSLRIARLTGAMVQGIDVHEDGIRTAREQAQQAGLAGRVTFGVVDATRPLPFEADTFDGIICIDAINHLPDRIGTLAEWRRILKPGGRVVFTDPIVMTGPLTNEEMTIRSSIGFFLFVPRSYDDAALEQAGLAMRHRDDRTANMASMARQWHDARAAHEADLRRLEGDETFDGQQRFFEVAARLAGERRLSRLAYCAEKKRP